MTDDRSAEDDRKASEAGKEIDIFSIEVLGYNRRHPEPGQPTPGSTIQWVEARKAKLAARNKALGAGLWWLLAAVGGFLIPAIGPWVMKKLGLLWLLTSAGA